MTIVVIYLRSLAPNFNKRLKPDFPRTVQRVPYGAYSRIEGHVPWEFCRDDVAGHLTSKLDETWAVSSRQAVQNMDSWLLVDVQGSRPRAHWCRRLSGIYGGHDFMQSLDLGIIRDMTTVTPCWCNPCGSGNLKLEPWADAALAHFGTRRAEQACSWWSLRSCQVQVKVGPA